MLTEKELLTHRAFQIVRELPLAEDEYAIMGTGIMFALGIRNLDTLDDLDLLTNQSGWEKVKDMAPVLHSDLWESNRIYLHDELIEIWDGWGTLDGPDESYNPDTIIKNATIIADFPFMSLEDVIRWKAEMGREKDKKHLAMIEEYRSRKSGD